MKKRDADKAEAIKMLRKFGVKPGARIYTTCRHVSSSGMSRHISCLVVTRETHKDSDGKRRVEPRIHDISGFVARVLGYRRHDDGGMIVSGCGMDMGFHVVYHLGSSMFPKGGALVHSPRRRQEEQAGETREKDGGYLLKHEWI